MIQYKNLAELINGIEDLPIPGRIYIDKSNFLDIKKAFFITMSSKEIKDQNMVDQDSGLIPENLSGENVKSFLDTATFEDIIIVQKENKDSSDL